MALVACSVYILVSWKAVSADNQSIYHEHKSGLHYESQLKNDHKLQLSDRRAVVGCIGCPLTGCSESWWHAWVVTGLVLRNYPLKHKYS